MLYKCKVKDTFRSEIHECKIVAYEEKGSIKYAACPEDLDVERGDTIELFSDRHLNYMGFGTIALRTISN